MITNESAFEFRNFRYELGFECFRNSMNTSERYVILRDSRMNFYGRIVELKQCLFYFKKKDNLCMYGKSLKSYIIKYKRRCSVETASTSI